MPDKLSTVQPTTEVLAHSELDFAKEYLPQDAEKMWESFFDNFVADPYMGVEVNIFEDDRNPGSILDGRVMYPFSLMTDPSTLLELRKDAEKYEFNLASLREVGFKDSFPDAVSIPAFHQSVKESGIPTTLPRPLYAIDSPMDNDIGVAVWDVDFRLNGKIDWDRFVEKLSTKTYEYDGSVRQYSVKLVERKGVKVLLVGKWLIDAYKIK